MKKNLLLVLISILIYSCSDKGVTASDSAILKGLDSILSIKPKIALDSLRALNPNELSVENESYYNLLQTIAMDKNSLDFANDSLIQNVAEWYSNTNDYYNYYRSISYWGVVRYSMNRNDTLSFNLFKKAEALFNLHQLKEDYIIGMVYNYLGKINKAELNFKEADYYISKSVEFNKRSKNTFNYLISLIDLSWVQLNLKNTSKALDCIRLIDDVDSIPPIMKPNIYNVKSAYYASMGDYYNAKEYALKNLNNSKDQLSRDNQYYSLSVYYLKLNKLDSAIFYSEKSVDELSETIASSRYHLYKHLADVYKIKGDYAKSAETYYKAYEFHQQYLSEVSSKKILELEKRYDLESKDFQLHMANQRNSQLTIIIVAVSLIFILLVIILWFRIKITKREFLIIKQREEISAAKIEAKQKKQKVINDFLKISLTLHPEFTSNYLQVVNSKYNLSLELYKEFVKINKNFNNEYRKNINEIIEKELNDLLDFVPAEIAENLSANEKVIPFLTDEGYTTAQIAELLNTTTNSIRTSRLRLISKINESTLLDEESKNSLKNFLHLQ